MKKFYGLSFLFLLLTLAAVAQKRTITGKVTNLTTGEALQGVNILSDKQKVGATTKADGSYSITVDQKRQRSSFLMLGSPLNQ